MKSIITMLVAGLLISTTSFAQIITVDQVPLMVQKAFFLKFTNVKEAKWELKDSAEYQAKFSENNAERSASFDKMGKWLQTESKIDTSLLPPKVTRVIFSHYADYKLVSAKEIETFENGTFYDVVITNEKGYLKIRIKPTGEIISRNATKGEKD